MDKNKFQWTTLKALLLGIVVYHITKIVLNLFIIDYGPVAFALVASAVTAAYFAPHWKIFAGTFIAIFISLKGNLFITMNPDSSDFPAWSSHIFTFHFIMYGIPCLAGAFLGRYLSKEKMKWVKNKTSD